jgi:hypothetical protein
MRVLLGSCPDVPCETDLEPLPAAQARAQDKDVYSTEGASSDEGVLMASTTVFVRDPGDAPSKYTLYQRSPTDGPRENFGGPWRNLDIICNVYVYYTVSSFYYIISNKQQQI